MAKKNDVCICPRHGKWHAAEDIDRLVRELDVIWNGEYRAAKQAALCDMVGQIAQWKRRTQELAFDLHSYADAAEQAVEEASGEIGTTIDVDWLEIVGKLLRKAEAALDG